MTRIATIRETAIAATRGSRHRSSRSISGFSRTARNSAKEKGISIPRRFASANENKDQPEKDDRRPDVEGIFMGSRHTTLYAGSVPDFYYLTIRTAGPKFDKSQPYLPKMSRIFLILPPVGALSSPIWPPDKSPPSGRDIVKKMHDRYAGKWYNTFTFTQTTQQYRNDTLRATQTWHEFIRFPDRFRMDFGHRRQRQRRHLPRRFRLSIPQRPAAIHHHQQQRRSHLSARRHVLLSARSDLSISSATPCIST